jgi:hypothetical protein
MERDSETAHHTSIQSHNPAAALTALFHAVYTVKLFNFVVPTFSPSTIKLFNFVFKLDLVLFSKNFL